MIVETLSEGQFEQIQIEDTVEIIDDIAHFISIKKQIAKDKICLVYNGEILDNSIPISKLPLTETSKIRYFVSHSSLEITDIHPQEGYTSGGTHVTLNGNFPEASGRYVVRFGTLEVVGQYMNANMLVAITPPHAPGPVSVSVKLNQNGRFIEGDSFFSYVNRVIQAKEVEVQCMDKMSHKMSCQRFASGANNV